MIRRFIIQTLNKYANFVDATKPDLLAKRVALLTQTDSRLEAINNTHASKLANLTPDQALVYQARLDFMNSERTVSDQEKLLNAYERAEEMRTEQVRSGKI